MRKFAFKSKKNLRQEIGLNMRRVMMNFEVEIQKRFYNDF